MIRYHRSIVFQLGLAVVLAVFLVEVVIFFPSYGRLVDRTLSQQERLGAVAGDPRSPGASERIAAVIRENHHYLESFPRRIFLLVVVISAATAALLGVAVWCIVIRPIRRIAVADRIAKRDGIERAVIPDESIPRNEIGQVMRSRNEVLREFAAQGSELRRLNATLVQKVEERTRELREREQCVREAYERLGEIDAMKSDLLGLVSHELLTPLTIAHSLVEAMQEDMISDPEEQKKGLEDLHEAVLSLSGLVRTIVDLSGLETGATRLCVVDVDLGGLAGDVLEASRAEAERKSLECGFLPPAPPITVPADSTLIAKALDVLVKNAIKFTPRGGSVQIRIEASQTGAELVVEDSGIGVARKDVSRIFNKFGLVGPLCYHGSGFGLSLPLARAIARRHGGDLYCVSEGSGKGSTFRLVLPGLKAHAATTGAAGERQLV